MRKNQGRPMSAAETVDSTQFYNVSSDNTLSAFNDQEDLLSTDTNVITGLSRVDLSPVCAFNEENLGPPNSNSQISLESSG